ncbi:hypothetical protein ACHQM5_005918 [Ranunculus cassubicifolius]
MTGARLKELESTVLQSEERFVGLENTLETVQTDLKDLSNRFSGIESLLQRLDARGQEEDKARSAAKELDRNKAMEKEHSDRRRFVNLDGSPGVLHPPGRTTLEMSPTVSWNGSFKNPKVDFPTFDGTAVQQWIKKAGRFFQLCPIPEPNKVIFASLYLRGRAEAWFQTDPGVFSHLLWSEFVHRIETRFSEEVHRNVVGEFNRLQQTGSLQEYDDKFEDLQPRMLIKNPDLSSQFFVDSYVAGLKAELRNTVQMFYPDSLSQARSLATLQQATLDSVLKNYKGNSFSRSTFHNSGYNPTNTSAINRVSPVHITGGNTKPTLPMPSDALLGKTNALQSAPKRLTQAEMVARREKGLCYFCDEHYSAQHRCKHRQLFLLEVDGLLEDTAPTNTAEVLSQTTDSNQEVAISLNALSGTCTFQTLKFRGTARHQRLTMLVDSGSTNNFLDVSTAKKLGCQTQATTPHSVTVAGGGQLTCSSICKAFSWEIQGHQF